MDMPADWAIERAYELSLFDHGAITERTDWRLGFARYIEAHEQPPVDPDLVTAREICAKVADQLGDPAASGYRSGLNDDGERVQFALAKLKEARGK